MGELKFMVRALLAAGVIVAGAATGRYFLNQAKHDASLRLRAAQSLASGSGDDTATQVGSEHQAPVDQEVTLDQLEAPTADTIDFNALRETSPDKEGNPIFPERIIGMAGRRISIVGFMVPFDSMERMNHFMLFPYPVGCYFCAPPSLEEVVLVRQSRQDDAPYLEEALLITGELELWREDLPEEDDRAGFLFILNHAEVEVFKPPK